MSIDDRIDGIFEKLADVSEAVVLYSVDLDFIPREPGEEPFRIMLVLVWLAFAALFFTFYTGFINIRLFRHAINIVRGRYDHPGSDGQINRFQALATSLSGTIGLGNIAGVAVAISVGGPGAVIWMILMGLAAMSTKFVEVAAGVKYRHHRDEDHPMRISGGPMYYLRDAFTNRNLPWLGKILGALFALCCIGASLGGGNMFQANQSFQQLVNVTGGEHSYLADKGWLYGLILAALVGLVIIGGIRSIARVTSRLVPVMGGIYLVLACVIIILNYASIPEALGVIFKAAFTLEAGVGGLIGGILVGIQRATFSNEAGLGAAAIVHSAARTDEHISQGLVGMLGPFIDTVIICTVTALMIVVSGVYNQADGVEGVQLTSQALGTDLPWAPYILALTVFLFAFSTMITWSYYGSKATAYLFGETSKVETAYKFLFLCFVVIGSSSALENVIRFADAVMLSMSIPNIIGLYILARELKKDLGHYQMRFVPGKGYKPGENISFKA